jgi:hypothetical protein
MNDTADASWYHAQSPPPAAQPALQGTVDWSPQFQRFTARWAQIQALRTLEPQLDVALLDSLWGWPRHRIALHHQLAALAEQGYAIRSRLDYRKPEPYELGDAPTPHPDHFPMQVGATIHGNYEQLLAASRLGVFATGFHYGWRNIVTLAWSLGLQTLQDPERNNPMAANKETLSRRSTTTLSQKRLKVYKPTPSLR